MSWRVGIRLVGSKSDEAAGFRPGAFQARERGKYRERRQAWREEKGWITNPEPVIPLEQREEVAKWQTRDLPSFDWAGSSA